MMIQRLIWRTYRKGQEDDKRPSPQYMEAFRMSVSSIEKKEGRKISFPDALARYEDAFGEIKVRAILARAAKSST